MSDAHHAQGSDARMTGFAHSTDGALERVFRLGPSKKHTPAIFVHAGAGFHSKQNENVHLAACVAAAEMGMRFLRSGATATEAVEASLKVLEDREITNAGYGSNLSIDGTVECDATIVDHFGRSGACGATPNIRNPISLAKLILDTSNCPLSLRRIPPNALVGEGARLFAEENGMQTFSNEHLVSRNARDRFLRWQADLHRAESRLQGSRVENAPYAQPMASEPERYEEPIPPPDPSRIFPRENAAALMSGTWNEGQPDSPDNTGAPLSDQSAPAGNPALPGLLRSLPFNSTHSNRLSEDGRPENSISCATGTVSTKMAGPSIKSRAHVRRAMSYARARSLGAQDQLQEEGRGNGTRSPSDHFCHQPYDRASADGSGLKRTKFASDLPSLDHNDQLDGSPQKRPRVNTDPFEDEKIERDYITDTVGAIAIDQDGHIAAGSSSGGIGMKHRGRLGPAALVGIGTAVIPRAEDDQDGVAVATVTSGTGEHMATTMASQRCAERIYKGTRRTSSGHDVQDDDEDAIMESFIANDFMGHPGVKNCQSVGAIGVMAVKQTKSGYYFYFAHNTDSFALASMGAGEKKAVCTISRMPQSRTVARGGRKIRVD